VVPSDAGGLTGAGARQAEPAAHPRSAPAAARGCSRWAQEAGSAGARVSAPLGGAASDWAPVNSRLVQETFAGLMASRELWLLLVRP